MTDSRPSQPCYITRRRPVYDPARTSAEYRVAFEAWRSGLAEAVGKGLRPDPPRRPYSSLPVNPGHPAGLFNGMVAPLLQFPVRGVAWYQGESNADRAAEYRTLLPALIRDWRSRWGGDVPFLIVQLPPFRGGPGGVDYAELRDAQAHAARALPKVGLVVTADLGDENDIHPQAKDVVGTRLGLAARAVAYGETVESSGPVFAKLRTEAGRTILTFDHARGGLVCRDGAVAGFSLAGPDGVFHPAVAFIRGSEVVVGTARVPNPVAVRYGWANVPKPGLNLDNAA